MAVIVSAPLTYLKCVCLGWRRVSCWDFNLLTEPSAAVVGSHISGIKSEAVQHVRCSSCSVHIVRCTHSTGAHTYLATTKTHDTFCGAHYNTLISAHMFSNARVENVGYCHFPCSSDCQTTLHRLQLKALITILLRHVIILMLSMEMNWLTIDLQ